MWRIWWWNNFYFSNSYVATQKCRLTDYIYRLIENLFESTEILPCTCYVSFMLISGSHVTTFSKYFPLLTSTHGIPGHCKLLRRKNTVSSIRPAVDKTFGINKHCLVIPFNFSANQEIWYVVCIKHLLNRFLETKHLCNINHLNWYPATHQLLL